MGGLNAFYLALPPHKSRELLRPVEDVNLKIQQSLDEREGLLISVYVVDVARPH